MAGLPLSLQDTCLVNIVFRVNEFPVEYLALLPRTIRRRLFNGLPRADILHLSYSALFGHLDEFQETLITARKDLLDAMLQGDPYSLLGIVYSPSYHQYYPDIEYTFSSLEASFLKFKCGYNGVVPKHLQQFARSQYFSWNYRDRLEIEFPPELALPLVRYCNMHGAPLKLTIDCYDFTKTMFWKNYAAQKSHPSIVIPFIQEFLSSVEELHLRSRKWGTGLKEVPVPFVILYSIVTSRQPHLKHLKVRDYLVHTADILKAIVELFCVHEIEENVDSNSPILLISPKPKPYQLEAMSIIVLSDDDDRRNFMHNMDKFYTLHIASVSRSIIAYQIQSLRSVTIRGLGFCYNDTYRPKEYFFDFVKDESSGVHEQIVHAPALFSLLNQFLKQPQFEMLRIDKAPISATFELIMTFLTTPTSQIQTLCIEAEEEKESASNDKKKPVKNRKKKSRKRSDALESSDIPPSKVIKQSLPNLTSQSFPETNAQYKCLDLGLSCSGLHSWLFTLPELKLKKLGIRTQDVALIPEEMIIQAEHIVFSSPAKDSTDTPTISSAHLNKLTVLNPALKQLEFTSPITPGLIPALNQCLSVLYQQGRRLEVIILNLVKFRANCDHMKEFFIQIRDFSLNIGTALVIFFERVIICEEDESRFFVELSNYFQEKKIKKIIFTGSAVTNNENSWFVEELRKCYELITDELVIHY